MAEQALTIFTSPRRSLSSTPCWRQGSGIGNGSYLNPKISGRQRLVLVMYSLVTVSTRGGNRATCPAIADRQPLSDPRGGGGRGDPFPGARPDERVAVFRR